MIKIKKSHYSAEMANCFLSKKKESSKSLKLISVLRPWITGTLDDPMLKNILNKKWTRKLHLFNI